MALDLDTLGLSATVTAEGISAPDYQTVLDTITGYFSRFTAVMLISTLTAKTDRCCRWWRWLFTMHNTAISVITFSPSTAIGAGLSSNVKINGITRRAATNSTVDLLLTGTVGTAITNGSVRDANRVVWNLPATVVIGLMVPWWRRLRVRILAP
jgi:hypothetical protein